MFYSAAYLIYIIPVIFISMAIHEAMHAFTAHALGDSTAKDSGRLTLNPLKHIDIFTTVLLPVILILIGAQPIFAAKPVPFDPERVDHEEYGVALVGIAGPLTNLVLSAVGAIFLRFLQMPHDITIFFIYFTVINVEFFIFNMIPIPPLDGSRLLYAFAPEPLQKVMATIESAGFMVILVILILLLPVISPALTYLTDHVLHLLLGPAYGLYL